MTSTPEINAVKARWQLLGLILIPIGVVLLATFIFYTRIGMPEGTRNKGVLVTPPLQLNEVHFSDESGAAAKLEERKDIWLFLMVESSACDEACKHRFWEVRQTRVALGKYQGYIQRFWLVTGGKIDAATQQWLKQEHPDINLLYIDPQEWSSLLAKSPQGIASTKEARFYLVDPRNFLMMYYRPEDTYKDVIVDMKFLLKGVE